MTPLDVGALASVVELAGLLFDHVGITCHRGRISGTSYGTFRQLLYGTSASYAVLFLAFSHAAVIHGCPRCSDALQTWAIAASAPFAYIGVFRAAASALKRSRASSALCSARRDGDVLSGKPLRLTVVAHLCCLAFVSLLLWAGAAMLDKATRSGVAGFSLLVILVDNLMLGTLAVRLHRHLLQAEKFARHEERLRFRERLASNVLTIADIRRATSTTPAQRAAADALMLQSVVRYGRERLEQHECCICFEAFNMIDEITRATCGHVFHSDCLGRSLERNLTCPLCRGHLAPGIDLDLELSATVSLSPSVAIRPEPARPQPFVYGGEPV